MIYEYVVTLRNERAKYINTISMLITAISAMFFLFQQFSQDRQDSYPYLYLISALLILTGLVWNWYIFSKKIRPVYFSKMLLVAAVTWLAMPFLPWIGVFLVLLSLLEKPARLPLEIGFNHDIVVFNTIIRRKFYWNQFNNVVLKDGMLTLDFKNNYLFQKLTIDEDNDAGEEEFNEYCRKHLKMSNQI